MTAWIVAILIALTPNLSPSGREECPGVTVVRNGLAAFAVGVTQIGPYTDPEAYLEAGLEYIALRCRVN